MVATRTRTAHDLLEVTTLLMRGFAARMRQSGDRLEPAHVGLLGRLRDGPCSVSELAHHQAVRLPTISKSISLLVERGWVERWIPEENRRQTMVRLTAEGRRVLAAMRREAEQHIAEALAPLGVKERAQVEAGLAILIRVLSLGRDAPRGNDA